MDSVYVIGLGGRKIACNDVDCRTHNNTELCILLLQYSSLYSGAQQLLYVDLG